MSSRSRLLATALAAAIALGWPQSSWASPESRPAADVHGDDPGDRYLGSGGLILPGSVHPSVRRDVAGCGDCEWRLTSPCVESSLGTAFDGQPGCASVVRGCPSGQLLRSWFRPEGGPWRQTGLVCLTGDPVTVTELGAAVAEEVSQGIPTLRARFQPSRGLITQVPVVFDSGQRADGLTWHSEILGKRVTVRARPTWTWQFGDGAVMSTSVPGGDFPDMSVSHVYRRPGGYRVVCTAQWAATFSVDGLGPYPVEEAIHQSATASVGVGEARAVLVAPGMAQ